jgi:hypothetical protein
MTNLAQPPPDRERPRPRPATTRPSVKSKSSSNGDDNSGTQSTSQEPLAGFEERIQKAAGLILHCSVYIDTVQIVLRRRLSPDDARRVIELNHSGKVILEPRPAWQEYRFRIRLHQPQPDALMFLAKVASEYLVNRIDIAVDFITASREAADELREFLNRHLTQRWHGKRRRSTVEGTIYFSLPWRRRNIAVYNLREAPHICHVETRLYGAQTLRRYGIRSLRDVIDLDGGAIITRNCRLSALVWKNVQRAIDRIAGNTILHRYRRYGMKSSRAEAREEYEGHIMQFFLTDDLTLKELPLVPTQMWIERFPHLVDNAVTHRPFNALIKTHICSILK